MNASDTPEVYRDDQLLDRLGQGVPLADIVAELDLGRDVDPVVAGLAWWRADLNLEPPVIDELALARRKKQRQRIQVAALVAVFLGVGSVAGTAAASVAQPGDPLWPVTRVVYPDRADSRMAREEAKDALQDAKAVATQDPAQARELLDAALGKAAKVKPKDERSELREEVEQVRALIASASPSPSNSSSPTANPSPSPSITPSPNPSASPSEFSPSPSVSPESPSPEISPSPSEPPTSPNPSTEPSPEPSVEPVDPESSAPSSEFTEFPASDPRPETDGD